MTKLTAVYAISENNVIGIKKDGKETLPWHLKEDLSFFKTLTNGGIVIMGMKTFESMNRRPLSNRTNIVLTRQKGLESSDHLIFADLELLESFLDKYDGERSLFVIGGSECFSLLRHRIADVFVTHVKSIIDFDEMTFMSNFLLTGKQTELIMNSTEEEYEFNVVHYYP